MPWTNIKQQDMLQIDNTENCASNRILTYAEAIHESYKTALCKDKNVYIMGQGINDKGGIFGTTDGLYLEYGKERVFDTPLSEAALMGVAVGTAIAGMRPIYLHNRPDFLMLAMDQIVNHASKYQYMSGGQCPIPLVVSAVTGQGWGSAAQHSQALQGLFMHIPGLKIVMPTTPYDAKGLYLSAIADENPILLLEHRRIFAQKGAVPEEEYAVPIGKGIIRKVGKDVTIVAISAMVIDSLYAAQELESHGIEAEVIDLRTIKPFDLQIILESIKKTGYLVIADTGWKTGGVSAEIATEVYEQAFNLLKKPIRRISLPDIPTPAAYTLEEVYYPNKDDICRAAIDLLRY